MDYNLLADLARLPWPPPHDIQAVYEEDEEYEEYEEALLPLDVPLMLHLPRLHGPEFVLPIREQVPGPIEVQSYVNKAEDSRHWPEYQGMDYVGVQEDNEEEWNFLQLPKENHEDEIVVDNKASQHGLIAGSLATKRNAPITEDNMLLEAINPSAPHIATIGLLDATPPAFGPTLEPHQ